MGSRVTGPEAEKVYEAAEKWVDCALHKDDSLFTPGEPIWSSQWLRELRARFLDRPDAEGEDFIQKLEWQLADSPPEVYQLMGEVLYVHYLSFIGVGDKRERIQDILGLSPNPITIPAELLAGLEHGFIRMGMAGLNLPYQLGFLIEFAEQCKALDPNERIHRLEDPWDFKQFVMSVSLTSTLFRNSPKAQPSRREGLLQIVHPDTFEPIISTRAKESIAKADGFAHLITEPTDDVDRAIQQIRLGLEAEFGRGFSFYEPDIHSVWNATANPWDEFIRHAKAIVGSGQMEEEDMPPKIEVGRRVKEVREAVLKEADGWQDLARRRAFTSVNFPIININIQIALRNWIDEAPDQVLNALQAIWQDGDLSVAERASAFAKLFPRRVVGGAGTRTTVVSQLMMGLGVEQHPPYRTEAFMQAYERTGYNKPSEDAGEAALYVHALGFLDRFIEEASKRGLELRHRHDAQSIVWLSKFEPPASNGKNGPQVDLHTLADSLWLDAEFLGDIETLLEDKKQVIFQGPPGTGKTYIAQKLARHLAGAEERVTLVQFHPSYAYEDFVQGYRPELVAGQPGFKLRNGPLLQAADRARNEPDAKHYLVVDEINRGNLAKLFGELYFLLEYRDEAIRLQYSKDSFSLPDNLYIIGTMNTADRSIALVDLALRRRFYFKMFHPDEEPVKSVLRRWLRDKAPDMEWVADVVESTNVRLSDDRHAAIGPSYFMKDGLDEAWVKLIWEHSVLPYIEERRFGGDEVSEEFDLDRLRQEAVGGSETSGDAQAEGEGTAGGGDSDED